MKSSMRSALGGHGPGVDFDLKNIHFNTKNKMKTPDKDVSVPPPACPGCGMPKNEWPGEGYAHEGQIYCCQGCAEGTGCTCAKAARRDFPGKARR